MSMTISSKIFISEGRGQPVSLRVKIDGCSDHGSNSDMLAGIWKDTLRKSVSTAATGHYEVETITEIINQNDYYFVLGERIREPNELTIYTQDLYVIKASSSNTSRSLGRIQNDLFSSELFESSEVNQGAFILPTSHAKKVVNHFIIRGTGQVPYNEEHYSPGSYFRICRDGETSDDLVTVAPVSHDVAVPCNDTHEGYYLAEMRHMGKATVPVIPPPMRPTKSTNPDLYVATTNTENMLPLAEENGHEMPEDVDYRNAFEEKGSHSVSINTEPKGIVFTSANTGYHDDERVVMTPLKDANGHAIIISTKDDEVSPVTFPTSSYHTSLLTSSSEGEQRGLNFSFNVQDRPVGTLSIQPTNVPMSGIPMESYTVAEEEVFEQEVPPTPMEPKPPQLHYSIMDSNTNKERRIEDCVQESVDVEPVEEKSCKSIPLCGKVTEAGMDMPLRSQQQCLGKNEEALVVPTLKSPREPLDKVKRCLYGETPQQSKQPASVVPGITQQPADSNCYTPDNRPVQASQQQQQLRSQSIWPGHYPIQQQQQHYQQHYSACKNGIASVPNPLGQPATKHGHFGRERTTTGPNACRPMQQMTFTRDHLLAFYPLTKGKVIHAAPKTCFKERSILPLQQLEDGNCEIGSGGNGSVFLFKCSGGCFAIKKTEYRWNELRLWSQFDHPNVIPLLAVAIADYYSNCPNKTSCWQVMPQLDGDISFLVDYGSLESIKESKPEYSWLMAYFNAKHILKKTLCGLEYLHRLQVAHRDIKERNVFYKMHCEHGHPYHCVCPSPRKCEVKLGDFDAMAVIQTQSSHILGTKNYRSPEMLSKELVSSTVDIYAFGCMVIKLVDGRRQYKNESEGICKVLQGPDYHQQQYLQELLNMRFKFENILTSKYEEISAIGKFIKGCVNSVPDERPSAAALLKDPFFDE